jgi:hypothetical protein
MYTLGSSFFGQQIADGELYQSLIGAGVVIVAFVWWYVWDRNTTITDKK